MSGRKMWISVITVVFCTENSRTDELKVLWLVFLSAQQKSGSFSALVNVGKSQGNVMGKVLGIVRECDMRLGSTLK